nr:UBN2 domain-containing protein [Tanacetum cinerariifolium]
MLLTCSELTKEDCKSQLYDEFERFKIILVENITDYYVRFHKLVNDMRNIKMTMSNIQLNSKLVNNMTPEWDRFVTAIKLDKGLKETNHEQLYAYLKQHEKHATYDRLINDKFNPTTTEPLALISHERQNQNQRNFARGTGTAGNGGAQNRVGNANHGQGKPIKCYNYGVHDMAQNDPNIFQANDFDAFDSNIDDEPTAQTIFMANLSSVMSSLQQADPSNALILSKVLNLENAINHHEIPNEVQQTNVLDSDSATMGNSNVIPYEHYVKHNEDSVVPSGASSV